MSGVAPGDTALFTCNPGFQLEGTSPLTCGNDGEWSDDPPTCRRKLLSVCKSFCTLVFNLN